MTVINTSTAAVRPTSRTGHGSITRHWSWTDNTQARRLEKQTDARARSQNAQQLLLSKTLAAEGKDDQGDNDADACDEVTEEEDDDVHPEARRALTKSAFHRG